MTPIITFAVLVRIPARDGPYLSLINSILAVHESGGSEKAPNLS